ncbi:MFS transporter [Terribacillus saccharophilus]|uniref:MFS transporter n=1 Tax=Terribacillus saccharophilus TaxID=361277 RepID=UPI002DC94198|nr:MFS transporter [Terribacillus saccharophilus]MEC0290750.1 MFS transporter [Terribacillus saccharophilus]
MDNNVALHDLRKWKYALFILFSLPGLSFSTWISRTPDIRNTLEASTSLMGWIIFGLACGSIIGLLAANKVIAKLGTRPVILICLILIILGLALIGINASFFPIPILLFLSLALFGLGYGMGEVAINVDGAMLEQAASKILLPALHGCFSAGTLIGAGLGYLTLSLGISTLQHLIGIVIVSLIIVGIFISRIPTGNGKMLKETKSSAKDHPTSNVWKEKRTILIGLIVLGMAFAEGTANEWLPLAIVDGFNVEAQSGTLVYVVFLSAMLIARLSAGYFLDRFGRVAVLRYAAIFAAIGVGVLIFAPNLPIGVIGVFLWGIGASIGFPLGLSAAGDNPINSAQRVGAVSIIGYLAFLVGPPLLGMLGDAIGLLNAMSTVLIVVVAVFFLSPVVKRPSTVDAEEASQVNQ